VKTLFVALMICTFVVPCVVGIYLIVPFLAVLNPYLVLGVLGTLLVAFTPLVMIWGSSRATRSSMEDSALPSTDHRQPASFQKKQRRGLEEQLGVRHWL